MRVVIAEDLALLREGLVALLRENGIEVVAQVEDGPGLLRAIAGHQPDLAIVDVRLPPTFSDEGLRAAIEARRRQPALGVLVLSQYVETAYASELIGENTAGIGYLLKERIGDVRAFLDALARVADGGTVLDRQVVTQLLVPRDSSTDALDSPDHARARRARADGRGTIEHGDRREPRGHARARSRSTSPTSSPSSTCPPATTITGACSPCSPTCAWRADRPLERAALGPKNGHERQVDDLRRQMPSSSADAAAVDVVVEDLPDASGDRLGGDHGHLAAAAGELIAGCEVRGRRRSGPRRGSRSRRGSRRTCPRGSDARGRARRRCTRSARASRPRARAANRLVARHGLAETSSAWCMLTFSAPRNASCLVG